MLVKWVLGFDFQTFYKQLFSSARRSQTYQKNIDDLIVFLHYWDLQEPKFRVNMLVKLTPGLGRGGGRGGFESSNSNGWDDETQQSKPGYSYSRGGRGGSNYDNSYRSNGSHEQVSCQIACLLRYLTVTKARPVIFLSFSFFV
jgi:hypothetical protein